MDMGYIDVMRDERTIVERLNLMSELERTTTRNDTVEAL